MKSNFIRYFALVVFSLALTGCATVASQQTKQESNITAPTTTPQNDNISRPTSEPYTGDLSIFEDPKRDENLQINRVMDILKIKENANVADIGAGSGWFTTRAAKRTKGTIYAVEINQEYVDYIKNRAEKENLANVKTILGKEDDPILPANTIDAVMILKTYHEIGEPVKVLKNLKKALRKDALVGIIDRDGNGEDHGIASDTIIKEAEQAGFKLKDKYDFVKPDGMDYFLVFRVK
jgi:protein-L-isoaspartate O-methyltransferase